MAQGFSFVQPSINYPHTLLHHSSYQYFLLISLQIRVADGEKSPFGFVSMRPSEPSQKRLRQARVEIATVRGFKLDRDSQILFLRILRRSPSRRALAPPPVPSPAEKPVWPGSQSEHQFSFWEQSTLILNV
jgi:hypothetical protein